jgi:DNA mismatch repair protein MutL
MIRKLPPHLVHQIAAGEVVERPASALKELLENALDAGATRIKITYEGSGLKSLSVEDDGKGIEESDLPMAFAAHATSKLEKFEDFENLSSLGFRGEALCSISAVADVEIWTSAKGQTRGTKGRVQFGAATEIEAADRRLGTLVTIRDLFSKLPARLKFLKSDRSETLALAQIWKRYALAYPKIDFEILDLTNNKKINLPRSTYLERVQWYFDSVDATQWIEIQNQDADWKLHGFMLRPRFFGKCRSGVQFYLNDRPIKDQKLEFAIRRGLEGFSLYPKDVAGVFYIEGSPKLFDVNVHPTKSEVRFVKPEPLFSLIVHGIRENLSKEHQMDMDSRVSVVVMAGLSASHLRAAMPEFESNPQRQSFSKPIQESLEPSFSSVTSPPAQQVFLNAANAFEFLGAIDDTYLLTQKNSDLWLFI